MRILLLSLVLSIGCSKKPDDTPAPSQTAAKPEEAKPAPTDPAPDEQPTPTESAQPSDKPTEILGAVKGDPTPPPAKDAAIKALRDVHAALEKKDYETAVTYFEVGNDKPKDLAKAFGKLIELQEISPKGIDFIAAKGKWGTCTEVFGEEKATRYMERLKTPALDRCYGFHAEGKDSNASVGFTWDGKDLKLFRLNNVGKLE